MSCSSKRLVIFRFWWHHYDIIMTSWMIGMILKSVTDSLSNSIIDHGPLFLEMLSQLKRFCLPIDVEIFNGNHNFEILIFSSCFCLYSLSDSVCCSIRNKIWIVSNFVLLRNTLGKWSVFAYLSMIKCISTYLTGQFWMPSISHIHCRERTGQSKIVWKYNINIISYIIRDSGNQILRTQDKVYYRSITRNRYNL